MKQRHLTSIELIERGPGVMIRSKFWEMVRSLELAEGDEVPAEKLIGFQNSLPVKLRSFYDLALLRLIKEGYVKTCNSQGIKIYSVP